MTTNRLPYAPYFVEALVYNILKRLNKNIDHQKKQSQEFHLKIKFDGSSFVTTTNVSGIVSDKELEVKIVRTLDGTTVFVDGKCFTESGKTLVITKIAAVKFTEAHFKEIDTLVQEGQTKTGACDSVAEKYGLNNESLRQQYYKRHESKTWRAS